MSSPTTTERGWQLERTAAAAYEQHLVPAIFDAMSRRLVAAANVGTGDRVLDVACGTGVVARAASRLVGPSGSITGVDVNRDMLATARLAAADATPPIDWHEGDAEALPFADNTFDVVLCQEALQFFADRVAALREMRRVAAPGGRVAFSVLRSVEHNRVYAILAQALGDHVGAAAEQMMRSPFALGDADTLRAAANDAGLVDIQVRIVVNEERFPSAAELMRQEAASSPLAGPLGDLPDDRRATLVAALERKLAPHLDDAGLAFHNETHVVTARA